MQPEAPREEVRLSRGVQLLVALLLLTSIVTDSAKCAWVLWQETAAVGYASTWTQYGACLAEEEC